MIRGYPYFRKRPYMLTSNPPHKKKHVPMDFPVFLWFTVSHSSTPIFNLIGLREKLQEHPMIFMGKSGWFPVKIFPEVNPLIYAGRCHITEHILPGSGQGLFQVLLQPELLRRPILSRGLPIIPGAAARHTVVKLGDLA